MDKEIFTGDWHIGLSREETFFGKTQNQLISLSMIQILDYAKKNKIKYINILGDIFHTKRPTPADEKLFISFLKMCENVGIKVNVLQGNHEANEYSDSALEQFVEMFEDSDYINIDTVFTLRNNINNVRFLIMPHVHKKGLTSKDETEILAIKRFVDEFSDSKKKNVVLGHFHVKGSLEGSESILLANTATTYDIGNSKKIDLTISGHIHKHQWIESQRTIYPGSIIYNNFGERNEPKGFVVLDTQTLEWEFKGLDVVKWKQETLKVNKKTDLGKVKEEINKLQKKLKGSVVKLIVEYSDNTKNQINYSEIESELGKVCHLKELRKVNTSDKKIKKIQLDSKQVSSKDATKDWLHEIYPDESDLEETIKLSEKIIDKVGV